MKQFFKTFFASLLAFIVASIIVVGIVIGSITSLVKSAKTTKTNTEIQDESVLTIDLTKTLHEQRETTSFSFGGESSGAPGLYENIAALKKAKDDDRVKALLIKTGGTASGWASLQALRNAIIDFKTSKKPVYAYGEDISQKDYFVASAADSVFLNPAGDFDLRGLAVQIQFVKGTLDKLGVQPEIFYAGKFKSATEPLRETKMSEPNRIQQTVLINSLWNNYLEAAAAHAKTDTAAIGAIARSGAVMFPADALQYRLIDGISYWDQVEAMLKARTGRKTDEKLLQTAISDYASGISTGAGKDSRVAVVFAEGSIVDGTQGEDYQIASESFIKTIRKVRDNDAIKAVVLRINSPGGSARASEVILRELELMKAKKKLVVSMGDVAASGGYYIASNADSIFAEPNTITGSIGVFGMFFNMQGLLTDKLGVTFDVVKNTPYADFPTATRTMNEDERARMQRGVDTIYALFKRRVSEGRKIAPETVDSIAQGRVWTGRDALGIRLVDGIGGLDRAVASAAALAGMKDYGVSTYPEPVDQFQSMLRRIRRSPVSQVQEQATEAVGPLATQAVQNLKRIQAMNGRVQTAMPFVMDVN